MVIQKQIKTLEQDKFDYNKDGAVAINTVTELKSVLVPESYDYIDLTYTGSNLTTVVYKEGGSSGTLVATLNLTYSGSVLQTVTRS